MSSALRYKVRINGGNIHFRVDMVIYTDSPERVEFLRKYAKKNKFMCSCELLEVD